MKKIVIPGELVTEDRKKLGQHVYTDNGKIYSDVLGLGNADGEYAFVVPLVGCYRPQEGDLIVGVVVEVKMFGFMVNISSYTNAFLSNRETQIALRKGDVISAKVIEVDEFNEAKLGQVRRFYGGNLFSIDAVKVPRVIGKNGSMLEVLKKGTNCSLLVGRNGKIWAKDGNLTLLQNALEKINSESHFDHLTQNVEAYLGEQQKNAPVKKEAQQRA